MGGTAVSAVVFTADTAVPHTVFTADTAVPHIGGGHPQLFYIADGAAF